MAKNRNKETTAPKTEEKEVKAKGTRPEQRIFVEYFGEGEDSPALPIHKVDDIVGVAIVIGDEEVVCELDDITDKSIMDKLALVGLKQMLVTSARLASKDGDTAAAKAVQKRFKAVCNGKLVARSRASTFDPAPYLAAIEAAYKVAKEEVPDGVLDRVSTRLTTLNAKERDAYIKEKLFDNKLVESEFYKAQAAAAKKESSNSMADFDAD